MKKLLILGINGSPHKNGRGVSLLKEALEQSRLQGAGTKLVHLVDYEWELYHGNYTKKIPHELKGLFDLLQEADGMIFSTPVNWFTMSALMKNFIDWLTVLECHDFALDNKIAAFIATCEEDGGQKAISDMMAPLNHMGFLFPPYACLFSNKHMHDKSEDRWQETDTRLIGGNVVKLSRLTQDIGKEPWALESLTKK